MSKFGTWDVTQAVTLTLGNGEPLELPAGPYDAASAEEAATLSFFEGVSLQPAGDDQSQPVVTLVSGPDEDTDDAQPPAPGTETETEPEPAQAVGDTPAAPTEPTEPVPGQATAPAPAASKPLYTHPAGPVKDETWPEADVETDTDPAQALYTFAGDTAGQAPTGASADWVVYTGATRPVPGAAS